MGRIRGFKEPVFFVLGLSDPAISELRFGANQEALWDWAVNETSEEGEVLPPANADEGAMCPPIPPRRGNPTDGDPESWADHPHG